MLKKTIQLLCLLASLLSVASAQTVFLEDFDGVGGPVAGGAGTYSFPAGWTLVNVDNRTPDPGVGYVNDAWERREDFSYNVADSAAFSTSWYSPVGAADDWMWTPAITVPASGELRWNAVAYDPSYLDGYEVRIMVAPNTPTGATGSLGNMVSASTQLFSVAAENSTWTSRSVSLSSYAGQTVQIAFRNNSNNMFVLLIDDVEVRGSSNDLSLTSMLTPSEYTLLPQSQADGLKLGCTYTNTGNTVLSNLTSSVTIQDGTGATLYTATSAMVASLAAAGVQVDTFPDFVPTVTGSYSIIYSVSCAETESDLTNNQDTTYAIITNREYARDNGSMVGGLGIGAGNGGYIGQSFDITTTTTVDSVLVAYSRGYTGEKAAVAIFEVVNGTPAATPMASTDTLLYADDNTVTLMFGFGNGGLQLQPGKYVFAAIEFDSTVQVGTAIDMFTLGAGWVNWPTSPMGGWANPEAFGASFERAFIIRPMLTSCATSTVSLTGDLVGCGSVTLEAPQGLTSYAWVLPDGSNTNGTSAGVTQSGVVTFNGTDANGCPVTGNATVTVNALPEPMITANGPALSTDQYVSYQWNLDGNPINGATSQQYTATANGDYTVTVTDANGCSATSAVSTVTGISIDSDLARSVVLYPNPATTEVHVTAKGGTILGIEILDATGRKVLAVAGAHADISQLAAGVYTVRIATTAGVITRSLVK